MKFRFLGGHPALDFINTVGGRTHASAHRYTVDRERLESVADLDEWIAEARLGKARVSLDRAVELREALYRIFLAVIANRRPDAKDVAVLNRSLEAQQLSFHGAAASFTT